MSLHHRTWFPFVLVGLSLSLVLLIIFFVTPRQKIPPVISVPEQQLIDSGAYKTQVHDLLQSFLDGWSVASTTEAKMRQTDETLSVLFTIRVPKEFLDTHLSVVLALQDLRRSLPAENPDVLARLQILATSF